MIPFLSTRSTLRAALAGAVFAGLPLAAYAQNSPMPAAPPTYARSGDAAIRGTVSSIDGKYQIHVRDRRGYIDNVSLHAGTIINPTGLPLAPGERVAIYGQPSGSAFVANEIDVPAAAGIAPYGYGYGFGYPYGGWGYGGFGGYGYGRVGFGFGFGGGGWGRWR